MKFRAMIGALFSGPLLVCWFLAAKEDQSMQITWVIGSSLAMTKPCSIMQDTWVAGCRAGIRSVGAAEQVNRPTAAT